VREEHFSLLQKFINYDHVTLVPVFFTVPTRAPTFDGRKLQPFKYLYPTDIK